MNLYSGKRDRTLDCINVNPRITIWAEAKGRLQEYRRNFSFGDSSYVRFSGYPMMCTGRILQMGLSSDSNDKTSSVNVTVNGEEKGTITLPEIVPQKSNIHHSAVTVFNPPIELDEGDVINFKSANQVITARSTIASLLVEIDC